MNFIAVRLTPSYVHPRVLSSSSNLPASMGFTFVVSLIAMTLLFITLWQYEIRAKQARFALRALRARLGAAEGRSARPGSERAWVTGPGLVEGPPPKQPAAEALST
jgi:hypothetical protein